MLRSVARRARVGRPVNVLNFQNRREKPRAAELPCVPRGTKGIAAWRLAPAPWGALLVWGKAASGPPPRSGLTIEGRDAEVLGGCWAVVGGGGGPMDVGRGYTATATAWIWGGPTEKLKAVGCSAANPPHLPGMGKCTRAAPT